MYSTCNYSVKLEWVHLKLISIILFISVLLLQLIKILLSSAAKSFLQIDFLKSLSHSISLTTFTSLCSFNHAAFIIVMNRIVDLLDFERQEHIYTLDHYIMTWKSSLAEGGLRQMNLTGFTLVWVDFFQRDDTSNKKYCRIHLTVQTLLLTALPLCLTIILACTQIFHMHIAIVWVPIPMYMNPLIAARSPCSRKISPRWSRR